MAENQQPIPYKDFAKRIKEKYPDYSDVDDLVLSQKMVEKYPEYKSQVLFDDVKKKEPLQSSATKLPSPNQPINPLQQGANIVGGGVISDISAKAPKGSIKEAALADKKKNESYLGALWNNAVGSVARLAGGAVRATYQFSGNPVVQMERELLDKAGKAMGKNLLAAREKEISDVAKGVVEKGRTSASSKEYERKIAEGFDVTDGLGFSDLKGAVAMIPQFAADMGLAIGTAGSSFAIQGYDDALSMVDEIDKDRNMSEGTRVAFGLGGAVIFSVLDKLGLDNLVKTPAAKKYVTAKVIKEATEELAKKGVKVTAEQFENTVKDKASKLTRKELTKIVAKRGVKGAGVEGTTEVLQEGGIDLLKLTANKLEGEELFDEEEIKNTAAKRYINSFAAGGILGGGGATVAARFQNTEAAIKAKLAKAQTVEDIDAIVGEINENVLDGSMTQEDAAEVLPIVENFVEVSKTVPETISGEGKVQAVDLINEREKLGEQLKDIEAQKAAIDPAFHSLLDADAKQIEERVNEINKELGELAVKQSKTESDAVQEQTAGEVPVQSETTVSEEVEGGIPETELEEVAPVEVNEEEVVEEEKSPQQKLIEEEKGEFKIEGWTYGNLDLKGQSRELWMMPYKKPEQEFSGGMGVTEKGELGGAFDMRGFQKKLIEDALNEGKYEKAISEGTMSPAYAAKVIRSAGLEVPQDILIDEDIQLNPPTKKETKGEVSEAVRVEGEPETKEGVRVVTKSGMTENERVEAVEERKKKTTLTEKESLHNDLIDLANRADKARGNEKTNLQGQIRQKVRELNAKAGEEVYRYDGVSVRAKSKSKTKGERYLKIKGTTRDTSGRAIKDDAVLLFDRSPEFVQKYEELAESPNITSLQVDSGNGISMTAEQIESALQDIADGIPSVQADNLLNVLEEGFNRGYFDLRAKDLGIEGTQTVQAMLDEFIGAEKEVVGEPMDEEALLKFLEEESKLESEEDIELLDNIENLITEYESEPTKTITKGEVSSTKTEPETRVTEQPKPTESGKSEGKPKAKVSRQPDEKAEPKGEDVDNPALKDVVSTVKALEKFPKPTLIDKIAKLIGGKKFVGSRRRRSDTDIEIERIREIDNVVNVRTSLGVKVKGDEIIFSDGDSLFDKLVSMGFSSNEAATIISAVQDFFPPKSQEFYPDSFKDENPEDINSIIEEEGFKRYINQYLNEENTKRHFSNVEERLNSIEVDDNWYSKKSIDFIKDIFNSVKKGEVFLMTENQLKDLGLSKLKEKQNVNSFDISEAYHKAKKEGNNPELVKAVEELLSEPKKEAKQTKAEGEPKPKAVEKKEEAPKANLAEKARQAAAKLRSGESNVLPEWLKADLPKGTKKQGIDINEAFANALETFADAYDKLKDFKAAAEKAFKNISDWYSENNIEYNEKELKEKFEDTLLKIQEGKREKERGTLRMDNKSILNRIYESENISQSVKDKLKDKLKYQVASQEEARKLAKEIIAEFGYEDSVTLAEAGKFSGDVNSMIFAEAIDNAFNNEAKAKTLEDKLKYAEEWKDIVERYDESARDKGRFISAIQDFYKKSPLGIIMLEESKRKERFEDWYKPKEKTLKEVFEAIKEEPEFKELIQKQVQEELKKERAENRKARRSKIEKFFDDAKFKGDALYAVPIPPKVINSGLELMKQAFLAGESVVNSVEVAIDYITKEVGTWDKDKFRKEYEEKLAALESKQKGKTDEELTQEKKDRILEKFRNKLKGLSESEKEEVIRKAFKKLVENGALEYQDFKDIIAETLGYGKMTEEEAKRITELVNDINSVETIADEIRQEGNRTIENIKKYKEAKKKAEKSATELAALVYNKPNILKRLLSIMQLNTLGIPSLVNNPLFNIFNQATVRLPIGVQLTALDQIIYGASKIGSKLFGTSVIYPENNIIISQGEFFRKAGEGASESASQLINGLTSRDYFQKEVYASQIQPFTSAKDLWDWKFKGKKLTPTQIADKTIQATVGLPAEVVARLLNIGDKPQRYAAEGAKSAVLAKEFGLGKVDYEYFLEFPKEEAFRYYKQKGLSDEAAMEKAEKTKEAIIKAGDESVFQQDNLLNDAINAVFEASKKYGNVPYSIAQAVKMLNFPYLKIPLNAFWSVYNLVNPEVAFAQSAYYSIKAIKTKDSADIQKAKVWAAHGTTGMALLAIAGGLVAKGIVNADNDDETTKKERMGEKQYEQQKSINVTKLAALLQGKDPDSVKHGLNVDLKYFANMGSILNTVAIRQENMTKEQKEASADYFNTLFANLSQSSLELIDNGVFSNASALVTAFDRGGNYMDNYLLNLINMAGNIVQPAMFAQHSRAQLPYYSKVKADTFYEEVKNNILARSSVVRALTGKYPPSQIGIWGDKLERKDDLILKWFGMSNVDRNNFAQPIYDDYKKTKNTNFLPPSVKPEIDKQKLTVSEAEKLEILVGNARKALIAPYINDLAQFEGLNKRYSELSEEQKLKVLDILYDLGYQKGKNLFIEAYPKYKKPEEELDVEKVTQDAYMQIFKIIKETE